MVLLLLGLVFIILTALGMPISFAVGVSTVFATLLLPGVDNATIVQRMLTAINTFPLLAVIFFVFAGTLMARGGIARRLVLMAEVLVGWLPGCTRADRVRRLDVLWRRHRLCGRRGVVHRRHDDPRDGEGRLFAAFRDRHRAHRRHHGPDHSAIHRDDRVRACRRQCLDRGLFLAGVIPGVMIGLSLMVASFIHGKLYHQKELPKLERREKIRRVIDGMAGVFTMVIILGGIISGVFTATEAGAAAAVYALILTIFVYKEIKFSELPEIIWECCVTNAVVMLLIATCSVYAWILTYENLPAMLADNFFNLIQSKWAFLLILNGFLLIVGMFVDMTPALIMLVPMLLPLALKFDIEPSAPRPDHGDQPVVRPDHAAGRYRVVRRAEGRAHLDGEDHPAVVAAARLHVRRAALRDVRA